METFHKPSGGWRQIIVARNGVFGQRMSEWQSRLSADIVTIDDEWGRPVDPQKLEDALKKKSGYQGCCIRACGDLNRFSFGCKNTRVTARRYGYRLTIVTRSHH